MSKAVLISIQPKWCEMIANDKKTIEIRKTKPTIKPPFKCYIYCTNGMPYLNKKDWTVYTEEQDKLGGRGYGLYQRLNGKVIGEFICDEIIKDEASGTNVDELLKGSCLTLKEICEYGFSESKEKSVPLYGWHISDLKIYKKPKELSSFAAIAKEPGHRGKPITRPPQSWCYVKKEREENG